MTHMPTSRGARNEEHAYRLAYALDALLVRLDDPTPLSDEDLAAARAAAALNGFCQDNPAAF